MGKKSRKIEKIEKIESNLQRSEEDVFNPVSTDNQTTDNTVNSPSEYTPFIDALHNYNGFPLRIHVNNIGFSTTDDDIEKFFSTCHPIKIKIVRGTGNSRCFCFVDFVTKNDFIKALELDKLLLNGRSLHIRIAEKHVSRHYSENIQEDRSDFVKKLRETNSTEESITVNTFMDTGQTTPTKSVLQRPRLVIAPRSMSSDVEELPKRNPSIFGEALPVDTATKDREIEEILLLRQKSITSQTSDTSWKEQISQPGKRLNMYKSKCGTSVSITSPGFNKTKSFFDVNPKTSTNNKLTNNSKAPKSTSENKVEIMAPNFNIWDQRRQERAKQLQEIHRSCNKENTHTEITTNNQTYANVAKTMLPDKAISKAKHTKPKPKDFDAKGKKLNQNHEHSDAESIPIGSSASSESSKIALAAVVSVAKLHQKKHNSSKTPHNMMNFMPIYNPLYGPYISPMGIDYRMIPSPLGAAMFHPPMYFPSPSSDFGTFPFDPWAHSIGFDVSKNNYSKDSKYLRRFKGNRNIIDDSVMSNSDSLFANMDITAKEFCPTINNDQSAGMSIVRQRKKRPKFVILETETPSNPLIIETGQDQVGDNVTSAEIWSEEVSSTKTDVHKVVKTEPVGVVVQKNIPRERLKSKSIV